MNNMNTMGQGYNPAMGQGMQQVGQVGQIGQVNPAMQQPMQGYGQQPAMGGQYNQYQQQNTGMVQNQQFEQKQSTVVEVARSNYTTIALLEVSGGYDPAQKYPKALCFVMGVPGVKDPSKQSGRTYNQNAKIVMKFSTQEIRSLGHSLINIAVFKAAATPFEKHSDPSKNSYSQNNAQQQNTKKLKASFDQTRGNIVITMNFGQNNVMIPVPLQDALGLGEDLINIGNYSDMKLFDYKLAHKIGREEVTGIDYDPAGAEDHSGQQPAMGGQYNPAQGSYNAPAHEFGQPQGQQMFGMPGGQGMPQQQVGQVQQMNQYPQGMYQGMPGAQ